MMLVALAGCAPDQPEEDSHSIAGSWVQVYPSRGALEALTLRPDGILQGSVAGLDSVIRPLTHWKIGHGSMPDGFCVGNTQTWLCQGFDLIGDTLWLANGIKTTYLRSRQPSVPLKPWESPRRDVPRPRPARL